MTYTTHMTPDDSYPDPTGRSERRYGSGTAWTEHVFTAGARATDLSESTSAESDAEGSRAEDAAPATRREARELQRDEIPQSDPPAPYDGVAGAESGGKIRTVRFFGARNRASDSGARTLLLSVLLSAPGPLVVGLGLLAGHSSTQIADFVRRSAELLAIVISFAVYRITTKDGPGGAEERAVLERRSNVFVGVMMCVAGAAMVLMTFVTDAESTGNVVPGLVIAMMGLIVNTAFWVKYSRLNSREPNAILHVQSRLYRAKSLVDGCVTVALLSVIIAPGSSWSYWLDFSGALVVAAYLVFCGLQTVLEAGHRATSLP